MTLNTQENPFTQHKVMQSDMHKGSQSSFFEAEIEHILKEDEDEVDEIDEENEITIITTLDEDKKTNSRSNIEENDQDNDDDTKCDSEISGSNSHSKQPSLGNNINTSSSSVIESLHEKIDSLTNTNLKLTVQSHNLLEDLEHSQKKEIKLNENISLYNHEYENLNLMLQRKVRKIHSTEEEVNHVREKLTTLEEQNEELSNKINNISSVTNDTRVEIESLREKYSLLMDSNENYKNSRLDEIKDLQNEIKQLRDSLISKFNISDDSHSIGSDKTKQVDTLIHQYKKDSNTIKEMNSFNEQSFLQHQITTTVKSRKMKEIINLYKVGINVANNYINDKTHDTNYAIPENIIKSEVVTVLENELKLKDTKKNFMSYQGIRNHSFESPSLPNKSPHGSTPSLGKTRLTPVMNSSPRNNLSPTMGVSVSNNNNNNIAGNKNRRSFYSSSINTSQLPGTRIGSNNALPGVRMASNERETPSPPLASSERIHGIPADTINPFTNKASKQFERRKR